MHAIYKHVADGCIRYIGETVKSPESRLKEHMKEARGPKRNHRLNWLRSLLVPPDVEVIEWVPPMFVAEREKYWIALAKDYGCRLVNTTEGGRCFGSGPAHPCFGRKLSAAHIEKIRIAGTGRKHTEAAKAKMRKPKPAGHGEKVSAARKGIIFSPEHRANLSARPCPSGVLSPHFGKVASEETRRKQSLAKIGKPSWNKGRKKAQ